MKSGIPQLSQQGRISLETVDHSSASREQQLRFEIAVLEAFNVFLEEVYTLEDALVCAGFLNSFVRHADVGRVANLAQMVNIIAPLMTRREDSSYSPSSTPFACSARAEAAPPCASIPAGPSARARNTWDEPDVVTATPFKGASVTGQSAALVLPPLSLVAATFDLA